MMDDLDHLAPVPAGAGNDRAFWLLTLLMLGGIALIARFRPQIEVAAAHPRATVAALTALEGAVTRDLLGALPALVAGVVCLLVGAALIRRWWAGPVGVPRSAAGRAGPLRLGRRRGSRRSYGLPAEATF